MSPRLSQGKVAKTHAENCTYLQVGLAKLEPQLCLLLELTDQKTPKIANPHQVIKSERCGNDNEKSDEGKTTAELDGLDHGS